MDNYVKRGDAMRKLLCLMLACVLITATFCSCDYGGEKETNAQESVNISFSFWEPSINNDLENALKKVAENYYEIHPEVKIEFISKQVNGYGEWLKEQFASNKAPTIISDHAPNALKYYKKGLVVDLKEELSAPTPYSGETPWEEMFAENDFIKALEKVSLAWFEFGMAYYYNADLYENLGLSVPKTWDEFMSNCEIIKEHGVTPVALMAQKDEALEWLATYIATGMLGKTANDFKEFDANEDGTINKEEFATVVQSGREPEFKKVFTESQKAFWKAYDKYIGYTQDSIETDENEAKEQILKGVAGHIMSGSWDLKNLYAEHKGANRMGIFRLPRFTGENGAYTDYNPYIGGVQGLCVSACGTDKERAAAIDFLEFLFSEEQYRIFTKETMLFPTMKGYDVEEIKSRFFPEKNGSLGLICRNESVDWEYLLKIVTDKKFDYDVEAEKLYYKYYGSDEILD